MARSHDLQSIGSAPAAARWGGLLAAAGYALLAGWGVPAQRTVWMLATVVLLQALGGAVIYPLMARLARRSREELCNKLTIARGVLSAFGVFLVVGVVLGGAGRANASVTAASPTSSSWC